MACLGRHFEKGFRESLIGFRICFNLDEAVCLSPWLASLIGLANWRLFAVLQSLGRLNRSGRGSEEEVLFLSR